MASPSNSAWESEITIKERENNGATDQLATEVEASEQLQLLATGVRSVYCRKVGIPGLKKSSTVDSTPQFVKVKHLLSLYVLLLAC